MGFFAKLRMTAKGCHPELREGSPGLSMGFFAKLRMTEKNQNDD